MMLFTGTQNRNEIIMKKILVILAGCFLAMSCLSAREAVHGDPGLLIAGLHKLPDDDSVLSPSFGKVHVWNTINEFHIRVLPDTDNWLVDRVQIYVGYYPLPESESLGEEIPALTTSYGKKTPVAEHHECLKLVDDLGLKWGQPFEEFRTQVVAVKVKLVAVGARESKVVWAIDPNLPDIPEELLVDEEFPGYQFYYEIMHPLAGHIIDSPIEGIGFATPTHAGKTGEGGLFRYFPGETIDLAIGNIPIGSAPVGHKVSPLDIFPGTDTSTPQVINMARLLQSLDADGAPKSGILYNDVVEESLELAMDQGGYEKIDFYDDTQVQDIIARTVGIANSKGVPLVSVSAEDAKDNLERSTNPSMFRKNVSKTPELASSKAKMNTMPVWFPALRANGEPAAYTDDTGTLIEGIPYYDENGDLIRVATEAKPIVVTYTDADPETGEHDVWAAVSRDDGNTWKRKNVSRMAYRSSYTLENGEAYYGGCKKPVFQVKGNKILIAWSSKFAKGGKPRYSIKVDDPTTPEIEDDYIYDDPYAVDDIWGVAGPQRAHDYAEDDYTDPADTPFASLEVPHSALWTCRGLILTAKELTVPPFNRVNELGEAEYVVGDIVWFKPERLTSGRRDVNQIFVGAAGNAGFAMVWQEDPNGVKPGKALGPGPGWGGATTSHKTDIWYSYLAWGDHAKVDVNFVSGSDEHDDTYISNRPKALVPMSLPVRLSDNEVINTDNILVELDGSGLPTTSNPDYPLGYTPMLNEDAQSDYADGTHRYAYMVPGLIDVNNVSGAPSDINQSGFFEFINNQDETKFVAITEDGRLLDGDTGASRGNIFLQPYAFTKPDGSIGISAWAIITYEETKGAGAGPPEGVGDGEKPEDGTGTGSDAYVPEEGKNVIYHSFDFKNPDVVSAGRIINRPEFVDSNDDNIVQPEELVYLVDELDVQIPDYLERPQLAYENARRGRFMPQGLGAFGTSGTAQIMVHKQGPEGAGRPSDILLRRWVIPDYGTTYKRVAKKIDGILVGYNIEDANGSTINPYSVNCLLGTRIEDPLSGQEYYADGVQNMSSVTPTVTTESMGDSEKDDAYGAVKVVEWIQTVDNLNDPTGTRVEGFDYNSDPSTWPQGNPFDESRAHRGSIRGDFVAMGFSYTANWAAARNGNDCYNFYVRRSFDGGQTWTTDPAGIGVEHCRTWTYPSGTQSPGTKIEECTFYPAGEFEAMRNLSQLPNHKSSVIEPRLVGVPGTVKAGGTWTGLDEDKQNPDVFYVAYGTSTNPKKDPVTREQEAPSPQDLYWSVSVDRGETYYLKAWEVNPDSDGNYAGETVTRWDYLAKGDPEQGECQLRMTPDGSRFYACWLDEGEEGSDILFRRILPPVFDVNSAVVTEP